MSARSPPAPSSAASTARSSAEDRHHRSGAARVQSPVQGADADHRRRHALYDSPVICEYLDSVGSAQAVSARRPGALEGAAQQALGDGILDATQPRRREIALPQDDGRKAYIELQQGKVKSALAVLEKDAGSLGDSDHRRDHHRLRAGLSRLPLRQRAVAARPSQARSLVRQGREAAAARRDHAGGLTVRLRQGRRRCRHGRASNS